MKQKFTGEIKKHVSIDGAYVEIPFDVEAVFGAKRVKVKASFDGAAYRGSIVRMGGCYMIGITQQLRKTIGKNPGDIVEVEVERDEEERVIEVPGDFKRLLEQNSDAKAFFDKLSYSHKREYVQWITGAKKAETRASRIEKAISMLLDNKRLK
ncbi:MAG: YdeI/OmpD-associated family protein [Bacillota bacterium]